MASVAGILVAAVQAVGGTVGLGVGYVARGRREHPAARPLFWLAVLPGLSGFCYAAVALVPDPPLSAYLLAVANAGIFFAPGLFLLFALAYTGRSDWITPRRRAAVLGVFAVSATVAALTPTVLSTVSVRTVGGLTLPVIADREPAILVTMLASYPAILVAFGLLGSFLVSPRNVYRRQTVVILLAFLLTVVGNLVFEAGLSPHPGLNLTSVFFAAEISVVALALFRYEFLNVQPLAPDVVLDEIDDPVVVLDEADTLVDANPAARALLGGTKPVGEPIGELLPELSSVTEDGESHPPGSVRLTDGGDPEVYDLNEAPIRDQYDRDRGTVVVLRDVTLLKQRERTLERLQSVSREFLAADSETEVLEIAVEAADELLDYPYSGAMLYDEDRGALVRAAFADHLASAYEDAAVDAVVEPGGGDVWEVYESGEPRLGTAIEAGGDDLPVDLGGSMLYPLGDHGVLGVSAGPGHDGFTEDDRRFVETLARATESALDRVEKEAQLRESQALLSERNDQIQFFDSVLRHDLRNGLLVIQAHAEAIAETADGDVADRAETIRTWSDDIESLAEKIQAATEALGESGDPDLEPTAVGPAVAEPARKLRAAHESATIDLAFDGDALPPVRADDLLPEVFSNLLTNAVEHHDGDRPVVTVDARVAGDAVVVEIADDGPGIDDAMKEAVFEKRVTGDDAGTIGFGLYFVATMVDRYGGSIRFEDRADRPPDDELAGDRGTVAVVELPAAEDGSNGTGG